ncbi:MAG: hypothetical protein KAI29_03275 [Cyclobacteriaceae bacterium]|nr:hypothetical protein [Cyclobacteriaceae bacterium]
MQTEFIKWYIFLFVIAFILYSIVEAKVKEAKAYRKKNLLYCIVGGISIGIIPLIAYFGLKNYSLFYFVAIQTLLLIIGILHSYFLYKILPWSSINSFWWEFLFSITIAAVGTILMLLSFTYLNLTDHYYLMLSAITWFFIPYFFIQAVSRYISIPEINFKSWFYPLNQEIAPPTDPEMAEPVVISFEFQKRNNDSGKTIFRAKAPLSMQLGKLFYYFVNDYNERHPDTPIEIAFGENNPYGWIFHNKPPWYRKVKYMDHERTIKDNQIKENSVVVCQRVIES